MLVPGDGFGEKKDKAVHRVQALPVTRYLAFLKTYAFGFSLSLF